MFTPGTPRAMAAIDRVLTHVEAFEAAGQLATMGWATVVVLGALRVRLEQTPEGRAPSDRLCSEEQAWLWRESEALQFTKAL